MNSKYLPPTEIEDLEYGYNDFIKEDSRGFIWISSIKGIYRFDGTSHKYYSLGFDENVQSDFFEDKVGNIWLSSYSAIHRYIRSQDTIQSFQLVNPDGEKLTKGYHLFHLENDNILWIKIEEHIYKYTPQNQKLERVIATKGVRFSVIKNDQNQVSKIIACPWLLEPGFEIISFSKDGKVGNKKYWSQKVLDQKIEINNALVLNENYIIFFTDSGLAEWRAQFPNRITIFPLLDQKEYKTFKGCIIREKELIVPIPKRGLWVFDLVKKKFTAQFDQAGMDSNRNIRAVYCDPNNHLWITGEDQPTVSFSYLNQNKFFNPFEKIASKNSKIVSIAEDALGNIWCASELDGIFMFNLDNKLLRHFSYTKKSIPKKQNVGKTIQLSCDSKGHIWSVGDQQVSYYDYHAQDWEEVQFSPKRKLFHMLHLSPLNKILSTNDGIVNLSLEADNWQLKQNKIPDLKGKGFNILQMFNGTANYHYVPYSSKSLKIFLKSDFRLVKEFETKVRIYDFYEDLQKKMTWLATSKGLAAFGWENKDSLFYNENFSLKTNISSVTGDLSEGLWLTNNNNITRFDTKKQQAYTFRPEDGFQNSNFSLYAGLRDSEGKIWFGINNGVLIFHPDSIKPYSYAPKISVNDILVNNEPYKKRGNANELKTLKLAYNQNNLVFNTSVIAYYLNEYNDTYYRLKGYNKPWTKTKKEEGIRFSQLIPKDYCLQIYGVNANGIAGEIKEIQISILPPWWQQWWARVIFGLTIFGLIYAIIRIYIHQKLQKERRTFEKQQALLIERNRIASELHDELGAGLSIIRILSESEIINKKQQDTNKNINRIFQSAGKLLEKMQDIIWALNVENDSLENLIPYLRYYTYDYLDLNNLVPDFQAPEEIPDIELSGIHRRNIVLACKEALYNIVKHAKAKHVQFNIEIEPQKISFEIKDDGIGMQSLKGKIEGNGVKNIHQRMNAIGGQAIFESNMGTSVRLVLPIKNIPKTKNSTS